MGWFKIENSDLVISDTVLDSTTRYLKLIFKEFENAKSKPCTHMLVNMQENLLFECSLVNRQEIKKNTKYSEFVAYRAPTELPDEILKRIREYLQVNMHEIIQDYQDHLDRKPLGREVLSVLVVALVAFKKQLVDPQALKLLQAKIIEQESP